MFQPRDGFVVAGEINQVRADIVIRIAEIRIDFDGPLAFLDGLFDFSLEVICPAEKRISLGRRMQRERSEVEFDGAVIIALHLRLECFLEALLGLSFPVRWHGPFSPQRRKRVKPSRSLVVNQFERKYVHFVPECTGRNGLYKTFRLFRVGFVEAARLWGGQSFASFGAKLSHHPIPDYFAFRFFSHDRNGKFPFRSRKSDLLILTKEGQVGRKATHERRL